jgi:hypothetical protein
MVLVVRGVYGLQVRRGSCPCRRCTLGMSLRKSFRYVGPLGRCPCRAGGRRILDVLGGDRRAVLELHAVTQLVGPGLVVVRGHRRGSGRGLARAWPPPTPGAALKTTSVRAYCAGSSTRGRSRLSPGSTDVPVDRHPEAQRATLRGRGREDLAHRRRVWTPPSPACWLCSPSEHADMPRATTAPEATAIIRSASSGFAFPLDGLCGIFSVGSSLWAESRFGAGRGLSGPRVEGVAEAVTEEVEGEHRDEDGQTRGGG